MTAAAPVETLSQRRLNRALLARQHLLERVPLTLTRLLEDVGGLQTQYAPSGYAASWSRMAGFERPQLTAALNDRSVIQATLMRVTIHTVSAADYWPMAVGVRSSRREWFERVTARDRGDLDMRHVADEVRQMLADGPMQVREIQRRLTERGYPRQAAGWANVWVDMVRVPPSGTWEKRRADLYGLAEQWLPVDTEPTEDDGLRLLAVRYLAGYGPAQATEFADWAGLSLTAARRALGLLEPRRFADEQGRELLDLPDAPLPDADTRAPVRFLPPFDATLLVNCRRTQILPERYRPVIFNIRTPHSIGTVLVDGQVAGTWRWDAGAERITTEAFEGFDTATQREVDDEAHGLTELYRG